MSTARLRRAIIRASANAAGYVVSGNHIFTPGDYAKIAAGFHRSSVSETPANHPAGIVRAADLLHRTF